LDNKGLKYPRSVPVFAGAQTTDVDETIPIQQTQRKGRIIDAAQTAMKGEFLEIPTILCRDIS